MTFNIDKGKRYVRLLQRLRYWRVFWGIKTVSVAWWPNESNRYNAANKKQADRWQKIGGAGAFAHHNTSIRLVYRMIGDDFEYAAYKYQDGKRSYKVLGTAKVGDMVRVVLDLPRPVRLGIALLPYIELVPTDAPHPMTFTVKIKKLL